MWFLNICYQNFNLELDFYSEIKKCWDKIERGIKLTNPCNRVRLIDNIKITRAVACLTQTKEFV